MAKTPGLDAIDERLVEFAQPTFSPAAYAESSFKKLHDHQVVKLVEELQSNKRAAAEALEHTVYSHYPEFIVVSKEIAQMESDMGNLRALLSNFGADIARMQDLPLDFEEPARVMRTEETPSDQAWLQDAPADLDVALAERNFAEAVAILERISRARVPEPLRVAVERRQAALIAVLGDDLHRGTRKPAEVRALVGLLLRLGQPQYAVQMYLAGRRRLIRSQLRTLQFQGDVPAYVSDLSQVVFAAVQQTATDFAALFPDRAMSSALTVWTQAEIDEYVDRFSRQVFVTGGEQFQAMADSLATARMSCQVLEQAGMAFWFYIELRFRPLLQQAVERFCVRVREDSLRRLSDDTWESGELVVQDGKASGAASGSPSSPTFLVTDSIRFLYQNVQQLLENLSAIASPALYACAVTGVSDILSVFAEHLVTAAQSVRHKLSDRQNISLIADAAVLSDDLVARVCRAFGKIFQRAVPELEALQQKLAPVPVTVRDEYCDFRATALVRSELRWSSMDYSQESLGDQMLASPTTTRLIHALGAVKAAATALLPPRAAVALVRRLLLGVARAMLNDQTFWDRTSKSIGRGGLQQLHIDVRFLVAAAGEYCDSAGQDAFNDVMEQAVRVYCQLSQTTPRTALQPDDWFVKRVQEALDGVFSGVAAEASLQAPLPRDPDASPASPGAAPAAAAATAAAGSTAAAGGGGASAALTVRQTVGGASAVAPRRTFGFRS